jgi:hypothetical protein
MADVVTARGVYYPDKQQVWWFVAFKTSDTPSLIIKVQVSELKDTAGMATRGFSLADGLIATATAVTGLTEMVSYNGDTQLSRRPIIGLPAPYFLQRTDTGDNDQGTPYFAEIITRPYLPVGIMNQWESMVGAIMGVPGPPGGTLQIQAIRDFGLESSKKITHDFVPKGAETQVIRQMDNLHMAESYAIQFRFSDVEP